MRKYHPGTYPCTWAALTLLALSPLAAADDWQLSGYLKTWAIHRDNIEITATPPSSGAQGAARIMIDHFRDDLALQLHYELTPAVWSTAWPAPTIDTANTINRYRVADPAPSLRNGQHSRLLQNLDRLNLQWQLPDGDLTIGRQAITFGAARIVNPSDIFLPFAPQVLNTEYRIGVDAVRYQQPLGELGEFDMGWVVGQDGRLDRSAAFIQMRGHLGTTDLSAILMGYGEQQLLGIGMERAIANFGFWLEAAAAFGIDDYQRLSSGFDYAFTEDIFAAIEYHYNGPGAIQTDDYPALPDDVAFTDGGVYLAGRHYLIPALTWQATPLLSLGVQALANLSDGSLFLSIGTNYSLADNWYLDSGIFLFGGDATRRLPDDSIRGQSRPYKIGDEFGDAPAQFFLSLRYYF